MKRTYWTSVQDDMMRAFYPDNTMATMKVLTGRSECSIYNRVFVLKLKKSEAYNASPAACRFRREPTASSIAHQFTKGHTPFNKGVKGWYAKGTEHTRFGKGHKPANHRPVGTIREVDGYFEIKIADGMRQWKLLHRVIWERLNGEIPKGQICIFLDGNTKNLEVTNLALMTKVQNMKRNSLHSYPKELAELIQLRGALNRQLNKRNNHEQPTA